MDLEEAKKMLAICEKTESRDHYFGDREVDWNFDGVNVATGYFGSTGCSVSIYSYREDGEDSEYEELGSFHDSDAYDLLDFFVTQTIGRNDEVGEDRYRGA